MIIVSRSIGLSSGYVKRVRVELTLVCLRFCWKTPKLLRIKKQFPRIKTRHIKTIGRDYKGMVRNGYASSAKE